MRRCIKCGKKAQIYLHSHRLSLCGEHYLEWFENRVERTIKEFNMFTKEEKILVAVSGGKDSLSLWHALIKLGYQADGFYINLGIGDYSQKSLQKAKDFAEKHQLTLHTLDLSKEIASVPELKSYDSRPACSLCGSVKRYYMNKFAREKGYTVLATGHNLDDESAVLFVNTLNWNVEYLKRQYPVLPEDDGFVRKVKPLCKISEKESALYAVLSGIDYIEEECPFSEGATSIEHKLYLSQLEDKSPGTKLRFYSEFLRKLYPLLKESSKGNLQKCEVCGEPSSNSLCNVCRLKLKLSSQKEKI
ncbi:TIGR00269 family protein [Hydrogenobacter hydrogenophilus]|uniref:TIGR00269 family protein n=1 Tax=Hydrogenobacter hydrogenophilus TaxID=35835 RepID=A0A285P7F3_9AQUI|nr:TIGR00269 family protein [Hydrogenobacter hydrogenophilus]SNZ15801.1 TIGR00269 family protein [Hydrogenobacter hydrogenophilus]